MFATQHCSSRQSGCLAVSSRRTRPYSEIPNEIHPLTVEVSWPRIAPRIRRTNVHRLRASGASPLFEPLRSQAHPELASVGCPADEEKLCQQLRPQQAHPASREYYRLSEPSSSGV